MVEEHKQTGTKINVYSAVGEFKDALAQIKPKRLHTFAQAGFMGIGGGWSASFIDSEGAVHGYQTGETGDGFKERVKPIYDVVKEIEIPEVDGTLRVSEHDGAVYQIFQTERPDLSERADASYNLWTGAVRELPVEGTLIQYLQIDDDSVVFDATMGKTHFVTTLTIDEDRTIESVIGDVRAGVAEEGEAQVMGTKEYAVRDNSSVIMWYKDLTNQ